MPTYDYLCNTCGNKFEYFQSMSSEPLNYHPECKLDGNDVKRIISGGTGLIFKGSGYYLTDYKNKTGNKNKEDKVTDKSDKPKKKKEKNEQK